MQPSLFHFVIVVVFWKENKEFRFNSRIIHDYMSIHSILSSGMYSLLGKIQKFRTLCLYCFIFFYKFKVINKYQEQLANVTDNYQQKIGILENKIIEKELERSYSGYV